MYQYILEWKFFEHHCRLGGGSILSFHPPIVVNVAPSVGPAVGYSVNIEFIPIGNMTQSLAVEIGGRTCGNVVSVDRLLRCTLPPGTGRNHSVVVIIGGVRSNGSVFVSYEAPILSQIVPPIGPTAGNNIVNLTGANFGICSSFTCIPPPNSWVTIGGQLCGNLTVFSDSRLSCIAPSGTGFNRTVRLSIDGQESNQLFYTYGRPEISGLVPRSSIQPNPVSLLPLICPLIRSFITASTGNLRRRDQLRV
ncbi:hypothetical protein BKA69DRAFT_167967 [Paraphysoderma sedebokerense]|nr:hypothetical protein BKA69DRAFT_167967 [Paraphysoderma sedebokerense]